MIEVCYRYAGKLYPSEQAARDAAEDAVFALLLPPLAAQGFTRTDAVKAVAAILNHRAQLAQLLEY